MSPGLPDSLVNGEETKNKSSHAESSDIWKFVVSLSSIYEKGICGRFRPTF